MDEEALASHVSASERAERGVYFTPASLVSQVVAAVAPFIPSRGALRVIDPACGAGAFLSGAAERWPRAELIGAELDARTAKKCRERLPNATVTVGNALVDGVTLPDDSTFELWLGNPPWNGTSPLLKDRKAWERVRAWLPAEFEMKRGTSLREDFVFFLFLAARRLQKRRGALAFVTSSSLLDAYAFEPVRNALSSMLKLERVELLPRGTFANTKVEPCFTVWTSTGSPLPRGEGQGEGARSWRPGIKVDAGNGPTISQLVPVSFAGLKTRFDELLVDDDRATLIKRVKSFIAGRDTGLEGFDAKLNALREHMRDGVRFDEKNVRPFLRYRGPNPMGEDAWCYVDRRLIPRGDSRMRGGFDPHASKLKLVFNKHELPLAAHVLDRPGCVTMYRHSRFAPEFVPRELLTKPEAQKFDAKDLVPNLTPLGARLGTVREVFELIAAHVMSSEFQNVWAPAFGT
ncbi:MAG: SAM-dependent DNA methyltransferase, partial [Archangium sp.]|nr:SAM-dependent DNA methyltransferase [Archangium sp.]